MKQQGDLGIETEMEAEQRKGKYISQKKREIEICEGKREMMKLCDYTR